MRTTLRVSGFFLILLNFTIPAAAQDHPSVWESQVELSWGLRAGPVPSYDVVAIQTNTEERNAAPLTVGLMYSLRVQTCTSLTLSANLLYIQAETNIDPRDQMVPPHEKCVIMPVMIGVRYSIFERQDASRFAPFLSAGAGLFYGYESYTTIIYAGTNSHFILQGRSETAPGGRLGGGVQFYLSRHFKFTAEGDYYIMSYFREPISGQAYYGGAVLSLGVAYRF